MGWRDNEIYPQFYNETSRPVYKASFNTLPWFERHELRNSQIRDVVKKSNYMAQYYGLNTSIGAEKTFGFVAANSLRALGLVVGGSIIVGALAVLAESSKNGQPSSSASDGVALITGVGLSAGYFFWEEGNQVDRNFHESSARNREKGLDDLRTYRYVRFMPNWVSVTDKFEDQSPQNIRVFLKAPKSKTKVLFLQNF